MWRLILTLSAALLLAGCAARGGAVAPAGAPPTTVASARTSGHAVAAALAYLSRSDPEVYVLDGYARPDRSGQGACATLAEPFPAADRGAIQGAFSGRTVHFVPGPKPTLPTRATPGALLLGAVGADLRGERGTVTLLRCEPKANRVLVDVQWDGRAWRPLASGAAS